MFREDNPTPAPPVEKRSTNDFLDASTLVIVAALVAAIICAFLVRFSFSMEMNWKDIGVDTAIISACTLSIYILLRSYTIRRGRRTQAWKDARERVKRNSTTITEKGYAQHAGQYCREWEQSRLDAAQEAILGRVGVPLGVYRASLCKYTAKELEGAEGITAAQRDAIVKAGKVRRLHYNETYLQSTETLGRQERAPSAKMSTATQNRLTNVKTAVSVVLTGCLSASFFSEVIFNFSAEAVIRCVVKLAVIAFFAALGMIGGYNFSTQREVGEMEAKAEEQERFIKWCETGKKLGANWGQKIAPLEKLAVLGDKTAENAPKSAVSENAEEGSSPFVRTKKQHSIHGVLFFCPCSKGLEGGGASVSEPFA